MYFPFACFSSLTSLPFTPKNIKSGLSSGVIVTLVSPCLNSFICISFGASTGFLAWALAASDGALFPFVAVALTSVLSFTASAGSVTFPVASSTVTPAGVVPSAFHFPSAPFLTVTVCGWLFSSVYFTSVLSASPCGVTSTTPLSFASTFGAAGVFCLTTNTFCASNSSVLPSL